mmetsp:Transcript_17453/g.40866  ORF Transcript_17453/g.40866 Transcript_17453/m.40866 type:complete len:212 (+) Transcript_17453:511-1146(+)
MSTAFALVQPFRRGAGIIRFLGGGEDPGRRGGTGCRREEEIATPPLQPDSAAEPTCTWEQAAASYLARSHPPWHLRAKGGGLLLDQLGALLAQEHGLEAVEVRVVGALLLGGLLLGPGGGGPLLQNTSLGPGLGEGLLARVTADLDDEVGQGQALEGDDLARDSSELGRPINKSAALVDNVDDGAELALVGAIVDKGDAADLNKALETHGC